MNGPRRGHIPALDGLRGLAVAGVVAHHLDLLPGGYLGVDTFFVLSGFLITGILVDEASTRTTAGVDGAPIDLGRFWVRRLKRLLPALVVLLVVVLGVERWVLDQRTPDLGAEAVSSVAYVFNWREIAVGTDYWSTFDGPSPLRHMWSLAIEEQFYLVWPLLVAGLATLAARRGRHLLRLVVAVALIGAVASVVTAQLLYEPGDSLRVYYGTDTRIAAILFGALGACLVRTRPAPTGPRLRVLRVATGASVAVVAVAWAALDGQSTPLYRGGLVVTGLATTVILLAAVVDPGSLLDRALSWRPLRVLGLVSYGLYLWHWPVIVWLTPARVGIDGVGLLALRLAVSAAATAVSYVVVEQPIRRAAWTGRRTLGAAIPAVVVVLVVVGLTGTGGGTERVAAGTRDSTPIPTPPPTTTTTTTTTTTVPADTLPTSEPVAAPTIVASTTSTTANATTTIALPPVERLLVLGDSGAFFLGPAIVEAAPGAVVVQRGEVGCGLVNAGGGVRSEDGGFLPDPPDCSTWPTRFAADVDAFRPTHVLFLFSWPGIGDRQLDGEDSPFVGPCDAAYDETQRAALAEAVGITAATGARVALATTPYFADVDGGIQFVESTDCVNRNTRAAAATSGADVVDLAGWTCPDGACRVRIDDEIARPDGLHFEGAGAAAAARWLVDELVTAR